MNWMEKSELCKGDVDLMSQSHNAVLAKKN